MVNNHEDAKATAGRMDERSTVEKILDEDRRPWLSDLGESGRRHLASFMDEQKQRQREKAEIREQLIRLAMQGGQLVGVQPHQERGDASTNRPNSAPGNADAKILAALSLHHKYQEGGCVCLDPIGGNALAKAAEVSPGSVTTFWKRRFSTKGHKGTYADYRRACTNNTLPFKIAFWRGEAASMEVAQLLTENERDEDRD